MGEEKLSSSQTSESSDSEDELADEAALLENEYVLTDPQLNFCLQGLLRFRDLPYLHYQTFIVNFIKDASEEFRTALLYGVKVHNLTSGDILFETASAPE